MAKESNTMLTLRASIIQDGYKVKLITRRYSLINPYPHIWKRVFRFILINVFKRTALPHMCIFLLILDNYWIGIGFKLHEIFVTFIYHFAFLFNNKMQINTVENGSFS